MEVRIATPNDLAVIVPMMEAFNRFEAIDWSPATGTPAVERLLGDVSLGVIGLVRIDSRDVGYFVLTWGYDLEWNGRDAFLTELWLEPDFRGRGVGGDVIASIEETAMAHGAKALHLMVRHENVVARRVYERAGFTSPPRAFLTKKLCD